jgi:hypothetical protein
MPILNISQQNNQFDIKILTVKIGTRQNITAETSALTLKLSYLFKDKINFNKFDFRFLLVFNRFGRVRDSELNSGFGFIGFGIVGFRGRDWHFVGIRVFLRLLIYGR